LAIEHRTPSIEYRESGKRVPETKKIVKHNLRHIILILLIIFMVTQNAFAQNVRWVKWNSTHALAVPENPDYSFFWSMTWGNANIPINITSKTNVTEPITWYQNNTHYDITVYPRLDSVGCLGEPIFMTVNTVENLSLHAFNDIFHIQKNDTLHADVSVNDFDELGLLLIYTRDPVIKPKHGTLSMDNLGVFTYTPDQGFVGIDSFVYEVRNYADPKPSMYANALVTIVVRDDDQVANLYIEKTGPAKALFGDKIEYKIIVKNNGPDMAKNVVVTDSIPYGLHTVTYSLRSASQKPWKGHIDIGDLDKGDSVYISIYAYISSYSPNGLYNQGLTYSDIYDPDITDNDSIWYTQVSALYVDLPDQLRVPGCRSVKLPNLSDGNVEIKSYSWRPGIGLDDSTSANPTFTPSPDMAGATLPYILVITDINDKVASDTIKLIVSEIPYAVIEPDTIYHDKGEEIFIDGSKSTGSRLSYFWWADEKNGKTNGHIIDGYQSADSTLVDSIGFYHLVVEDQQECKSYDSVLVLLESHPPLAVNDYVEIEAGKDSTVNVLLNDGDVNDFDIRLTQIVTPPRHGDFSFNSTDSTITYSPYLQSWVNYWDSIQYEICNNGIPEKCNTAWLIIHILRPPLNADVVVTKAADRIAFWGDSIIYSITISSMGPDTASVISLDDKIDKGLTNPEFSYSTDSLQAWSGWFPWKNQFDFNDPLIPNVDVFHLKIRAYIDPRGEGKYQYISNTAYISTDIIENVPETDTMTVVTKIKQKVIARAGQDKLLGACKDPLKLDGTKSTGDSITYHWLPKQYLDNPESATPTFTPPIGATGIFTFYLTVIDNDLISSVDTVNIRVLPYPVAEAGDYKFLKFGGDVTLIGSLSTGGTLLDYLWTTTDGHFLKFTQTSDQPIVDSLGTYHLTVTDSAGCTAFDSVEVFRFYYKPLAIPDYYSTARNVPITTENVLDNDYDPNGLFKNVFVVTPVNNLTTGGGGKVTINSNGSFHYTPPPDWMGVDVFTYEVCNTTPDGCSRGYVKITVSDKIKECNLSIDKSLVNEVVLVGQDVDFVMEIKNSGEVDLTDIVITDSISDQISNTRYSFDNLSWSTWTGELGGLKLDAGLSRKIFIRGKVRTDTPYNRLINAAMVSSPSYDACFDWDDRETRNVDTASFFIENILIADAELIERSDGNNDGIIGVCDNRSILSAANSKGTLGIDSYEWLPHKYVTSISAITTTLNLTGLSDTTIVFTLIIRSGEKSKVAYVPVTISPLLIADAGPDKKINEGEPFTIDATNSQGAGAIYTWWQGSTPYLNFENGNSLHPIITNPGMYVMNAIDKHGCTDSDTVFVRENQLFAINDILVVITNTSLKGNVATNDFDPNGDSIYYTGVVLKGPLHGTLTANPPGIGGVVGTNGAKISNNGTYIYKPNNNYIGDDYFIYQVRDNNNPDLYVSGKVFIKVIDVDLVNSQPVANHDVFFVNKNSSITSNLLANDYDYDGGTIAIELNAVIQPRKGVLTLNPDGTFNYKPNFNEVGADSFYYRIRDNGNPVRFDTTMVFVYINKIEEDNHRPVAVDDAYYVVEKKITGNLLLNDYDPDGNGITLDQFVTVYPSQGNFVFTDSYGGFEYLPNPGFEGTDQLVYQIVENGTYDNFTSTATVYFTSLSEKRYHTDMVIAKSGPKNILSGNVIQYAITATSAGPTFANDVVIIDTISSELRNVEYSDDGGVTWNAWAGSYKIDRIELYDQAEIFIRALLPDTIWQGLPDTLSVDLPNTAWVNHDMTESKPGNNDSTWVTTVYQKVLANAGRDTLIGSCITAYRLDASGSIGMGTLQYLWSPSDDLNNAKLPNPLYTSKESGPHKFTVIVSSTYDKVFGNIIGSDTAEVWIEVANKPVADAGEEFWNVVDTVTLDGSGSFGEGPLAYKWYQYDKDNQVVVIDTTVSIDLYRSGDFYLEITDKYGCTNTHQTHIGYKFDPLIAVDDYAETNQQEPTICIKVLENDIIDSDDDFDLSLLTVNIQPKHGTIVETPGDSCFTYIPEPYYIGNDTFTYVVSTVYGFSDEANVVIRISEMPAKVPEGFSPNNDGINDFLIIENIEKYESNSLIIFNRWGNIVYKKSKYSNSEPWDGIANKGIRIGQGAVPAGIYLYILDLGDDKINKVVNDVVVNERIKKGNIYVATDNR
jgi:uncharacterized repeat protein (TIGR01451 family)/gliding motility-associated-like protein